MNTKMEQMPVFANVPLRRTLRQLALVTCVSLCLGGCGDSTPEARLEAAGDDLSDSATDLDNLNTRIEETESRLAKLRNDRRDLRDKVRTLEQRLAIRATDVAVFRAVQTAILEDETLQETAIGVSVEDGAVTLSGVVPTHEMTRRAIAIAKETAGVDRVSSSIQVNDPAASESGGS